MRINSIKRVGQVTLYPLSDVHWPNHEHDHLLEWRKIVEEDETAIVTLGGDLFDLLRTTARKHLKAYTSDSNSFNPLDELAMVQVNNFAEFLEPVKSKIVGAVAGNHNYEFSDGQVSDQKVMLNLGLSKAWLGACGFVKVRQRATKGSKMYSLTILLHHDAGSKCITPGADFNVFHRAAANTDSDIICLGHTHRLYSVPGKTCVTVSDEDHIGNKQTIHVRSGSYMKRYTENSDDPHAPFRPDYGEEKLYAPSTFGHASVTIRIHKGRPRYRLITEVL